MVRWDRGRIKQHEAKTGVPTCVFIQFRMFTLGPENRVTQQYHLQSFTRFSPPPPHMYKIQAKSHLGLIYSAPRMSLLKAIIPLASPYQSDIYSAPRMSLLKALASPYQSDIYSAPRMSLKYHLHHRYITVILFCIWNFTKWSNAFLT